MYVLKHDDRKNNTGYSGYGYFAKFCNKKKGTFELVHEVQAAKQFLFLSQAKNICQQLNQSGWKFQIIKL